MKSEVTKRFVECHDQLVDNGHVRSTRQFALALDYLPQSMGEVLRGRREINVETLRRLVDKFNVNPDFLIKGEKPMFQGDELAPKGFKILPITIDDRQDPVILHVPYQAFELYAGETVDERFVKTLPYYSLPEMKYKTGIFRSFEVPDNSMAPYLIAGETVICSYMDPVYWSGSTRDSDVYVVVSHSDVHFGHLDVHLNEKDRRSVEVVPDDPDYVATEVKEKHLREIWQVQAKLGPFMPARNLMTERRPPSKLKLQKELDSAKSKIEALEEEIFELKKPPAPKKRGPKPKKKPLDGKKK
jgi:hypothetical protein